MTDRQDDLIRARAYAIWQAEGCPNDRHEQHWHRAAEELAQASAAPIEPATPIAETAAASPVVAPDPPAAVKRPRKAASGSTATRRTKKSS